MRRLLRAEAAALAQELAKHQGSLKKRLQDLEKRLQNDSDTLLLSDIGLIRDELSSVRRGLARLSISEQSTRKLKNEWHDWMRHEEASEGVDHLLREERLEMLASELRLRGHAPSGAWQVADTSARNVAHTEEASRAEDVSSDALASVREMPVETALSVVAELEGEEESEAQVDWTAVGEYWEQLISGCHPRHTDATQLARLLKAFREVQGERKRLERRQGVTRYRLSAFETWS